MALTSLRRLLRFTVNGVAVAFVFVVASNAMLIGPRRALLGNGVTAAPPTPPFSPIPGYKSGVSYPPLYIGKPVAGANCGANTICCAVGYLGANVIITGLGFDITTQSVGGKISGAVYSIDPSNINRPGAIADANASTVDISTTVPGYQNGSLVAPVSLPQNWYFFCSNRDNAAVATTVYSSQEPNQAQVLGSQTGARVMSTSMLSGLTIPQAYGTWPPTLVGATVVEVAAVGSSATGFTVQ